MPRRSRSLERGTQRRLRGPRRGGGRQRSLWKGPPAEGESRGRARSSVADGVLDRGPAPRSLSPGIGRSHSSDLPKRRLRVKIKTSPQPQWLIKRIKYERPQRFKKCNSKTNKILVFLFMQRKRFLRMSSGVCSTSVGRVTEGEFLYTLYNTNSVGVPLCISPLDLYQNP